MKAARPFAFLLLPLCLVPAELGAACDCKAPSLQTALNDSQAVFRGKVTRLSRLRGSPKDRDLHSVHFSVLEAWKGVPARGITVYDAAPRGDCLGAGFEKGKEYLVFARPWTVGQSSAKTPAEAHALDPWADALDAGKNILIGAACTRTMPADSAEARDDRKELGAGNTVFP